MLSFAGPSLGKCAALERMIRLVLEMNQLAAPVEPAVGLPLPLYAVVWLPVVICWPHTPGTWQITLGAIKPVNKTQLVAP